MIARIRADIRLTHEYTCSTCGAKKEGQSEPMLISADSVEDLTETLRAVTGVVNPHYQPIGWGSFFNEVYKCPTCLLEGVKNER